MLIFTCRVLLLFGYEVQVVPGTMSSVMKILFTHCRLLLQLFVLVRCWLCSDLPGVTPLGMRYLVPGTKYIIIPDL